MPHGNPALPWNVARSSRVDRQELVAGISAAISATLLVHGRNLLASAVEREQGNPGVYRAKWLNGRPLAELPPHELAQKRYQVRRSGAERCQYGAFPIHKSQARRREESECPQTKSEFSARPQAIWTDDPRVNSKKKGKRHSLDIASHFFPSFSVDSCLLFKLF